MNYTVISKNKLVWNISIVLVHFPFTDLSQTKLRPALILSTQSTKDSIDFVCVQITSKLVHTELFFPLKKEMIDGSLMIDSGVRLHKIFCLNQKLIVDKIAALKPISYEVMLTELIDKVFKQ